MPVPDDPEFDSDLRGRIYEYVERNGAVPAEEVHAEVLVDDDPDSKPARSGQRTRVRMDPATFASHLASLLNGGYLVEDDGVLRVGVRSDEEVLTLDDETPVTIRLAREADCEDLIDAVRSVAGERTHIVAETAAEALDDEPVIRYDGRHSRVFFVATLGAEGSEDGNEDEHPDDERPGEQPTQEDGVIGWAHVESPELEKLRHTAELTVGVREPFRGNGVGSRLLERGLEWARERGYRKVYQSVPATNEAGIDFLEDRGWIVEAVREDHYLVGEDLVDEVMLATWLEESNSS